MEEASVGRSFDQGINFHEPTAMTMKLSLQAIASRTILFCNTKMLLVSSVCSCTCSHARYDSNCVRFEGIDLSYLTWWSNYVAASLPRVRLSR